MKYLVVLVMLVAVNCFASTYEKVDDSNMKVISQFENTYTIAQLNSEIASLEQRKASQQKHVDDTQSEIDRLNILLNEATKLGIKEPIKIIPIEEPIE